MTKHICPTCGQKTVDLTLSKAELFWNVEGLHFGPVGTAILWALKSGPLTTTQLAERIYGACWDTPEFPSKAIRTALYGIRQKLPSFGWAISNDYGSGRNGAIYRLHQED